MPAQTAFEALYASLDDDVVASGSVTRPVPTPSTGETLHELPQSSADDVRDAISRARLAQVAWARAGFAHRRRVLLRAHDLLLEGITGLRTATLHAHIEALDITSVRKLGPTPTGPAPRHQPAPHFSHPSNGEGQPHAAA